jgi:hypothetical protein
MMKRKIRQISSTIQHKLAGQENETKNSNVYNWKMFVVFFLAVVKSYNIKQETLWAPIVPRKLDTIPATSTS